MCPCKLCSNGRIDHINFRRFIIDVGGAGGGELSGTWLLCLVVVQNSIPGPAFLFVDYMWEESSEPGGPFPFDKSELILFFHYLRGASE